MFVGLTRSFGGINESTGGNGRQAGRRTILSADLDRLFVGVRPSGPGVTSRFEGITVCLAGGVRATDGRRPA